MNTNLIQKLQKNLTRPYGFDDLPDDLKFRIQGFILNCVTIYDSDEETTSDIFLRLQEGMPLNSPENLNAMRGKFRKIVIELSQNNFFQKIGLVNTRFAHRYLAAQILILELEGNPSENQFQSVKFPT